MDFVPWCCQDVDLLLSCRGRACCGGASMPFAIVAQAVDRGESWINMSVRYRAHRALDN